MSDNRQQLLTVDHVSVKALLLSQVLASAPTMGGIFISLNTSTGDCVVSDFTLWKALSCAGTHARQVVRGLGVHGQ